jgi:hypothetical protein
MGDTRGMTLVSLLILVLVIVAIVYLVRRA